MEERKFNVGDVCRVRDWSDMAEEFGMDGDVILCDQSFVNDMRYLCGQRFTVSEISAYGIYSSVEGIEKCDGMWRGFWNISADMLEFDPDYMEIEEEDDFTAAGSFADLAAFLNT